MKRRQYLALLGSGLTLPVAGCVGGGDDDEGSDGGNGGDGSSDGGNGGDGSSDGGNGNDGPSVSGSWPQPGFDAGNSGHAPNLSGPSGTPEVAWQVQPLRQPVENDPVVAHGRVYVGVFDTVYAYDAGTGEELWTNFGRSGDLAVVDDAVILAGGHGQGNGTVRSLDAASGEQQWSVDFDSGAVYGPTVSGGTIYGVNSGTDEVIAISTDGTEQWRTAIDMANTWAPAVEDGTVVTQSSRDGDIVGLDASNGDQLWTHTEVDDETAGVSLVDGVAYVAGDRNDQQTSFYAIDAETGDTLWTFDLDPRRNSTGTDTTPAVTGDTVYFGTLDGALHALDRGNGDKQWEYRTEPMGEDTYSEVFGDPVVADGTVYFGGGFSNLHALDAATGDRNWRHSFSDRVDAKVRTQPAVADGRLYVGSRDRNLYAFE